MTDKKKSEQSLNEKLDAIKFSVSEQNMDASAETGAKEEVEVSTSDKEYHFTENEMNVLYKKLHDAAIEEAKKAVTSEKSQGVQSDILQQLVDAIKSSNTETKDGRLIRPISRSMIDPSDVMDKPAVFFCYSFTWSLLGDKKFGQDVTTPYKTPIRFEHVYRYNKQGKTRFDNSTVCLSSAKIWSKKEVEFLRNHTLFNIKFFEKIDDVKRYDISFAEKMVEINNMLNNMSQFEVIERAKLEGVEPSADVDKVRRDLTFKLAQGSMQKDTSKHPTVNFFDTQGNETKEPFMAEQNY